MTVQVLREGINPFEKKNKNPFVYILRISLLNFIIRLKFDIN